jgi:hypothetical protein
MREKTDKFTIPVEVTPYVIQVLVLLKWHSLYLYHWKRRIVLESSHPPHSYHPILRHEEMWWNHGFDVGAPSATIATTMERLVDFVWQNGALSSNEGLQYSLFGEKRLVLCSTLVGIEFEARAWATCEMPWWLMLYAFSPKVKKGIYGVYDGETTYKRTTYD